MFYLLKNAFSGLWNHFDAAAKSIMEFGKSMRKADRQYGGSSHPIPRNGRQRWKLQRRKGKR